MFLQLRNASEMVIVERPIGSFDFSRAVYLKITV
jgi:hypothetical protein